MQFTVPHLSARPDLDRIESELVGRDPSVVVDFDAAASTLRLATVLGEGDVAAALEAAGLAVTVADVRRQPSECCGGCGG